MNTILFSVNLPLDMLTEQLPGCECQKGVCKTGCECLAKTKSIYFERGLKINPRDINKPIFECNDECVCSNECESRMVQGARGRRTVYIYKEPEKEYGCGLRAGENLESWAWVCNYEGEYLTEDEAIEREEEYMAEQETDNIEYYPTKEKSKEILKGYGIEEFEESKKKKQEYITLKKVKMDNSSKVINGDKSDKLFETMDELRNKEGRKKFIKATHNYVMYFCINYGITQRRICIDGGVSLNNRESSSMSILPDSSYINHSCDPNCWVVPVYVNSPYWPVLAIFTLKDIEKDTQLTLNYSQGANSQLSNKRCLCRSINCSLFLPNYR